jgi:hypothetical protein
VSNEFWWGFGAGGVFVSLVTLGTAVVRGVFSRQFVIVRRGKPVGVTRIWAGRR